MELRTDPVVIGGLADDLEGSTADLGSVKLAPEADAGASTAALSAALADLVRSDAGLAETAASTSEDLRSNQVVYANTEAENIGAFKHTGPR